MKQIVNKVARTAVLTLMAGLVLWIADRFSGTLEPKPQGWILLALTAIFLVSEAFFWKAIDNLSEIPKTEILSADESQGLANRINGLKSALIRRWFFLLGLKSISGGSAVFLTNQTAVSGAQHFLWLAGILALFLSLPVALSFFHNWQQADLLKTKLMLDAKRLKEQEVALAALRKQPDKPLSADKPLQNYTKIVKSPRPASAK